MNQFKFIFALFFFIITNNIASGQVITGPATALTGCVFPFQITLQGNLAANCNRTVAFTTTSNLILVSNTGIPAAMPGNQAFVFNVNYQFAPGVTCNGAVGTITVTVSSSCGGTITGTATVTAQAANTWTITKQFVSGNLTCGQSLWRIVATQNNLNAQGCGSYNLNGTITETTGLPVISGGLINVNMAYNYPNGSFIIGMVVLQNCAAQNSVITNTASCSLTLGPGCGNINYNISAVSPALASPNASISFTKSSYSSNYTTGCQGYYYICIYNNGNVPWTSFNVTDNLSINGLTVTSVNLPAGWGSSPVMPPYTGLHSFTSPIGFVLNPGAQTCIYIYFTITGTFGDPPICNTATLSYKGSGGTGSGGGGSPCPAGIICPTINTAIQNTTANNCFPIEQAKAVPSIKKCIVSPPPASIYNVGDPITFKIQVGNSGSGNLTTTINDLLGTPQNLLINPASITYKYYPNEYYSTSPYCFTPSTTGVTPPFPVTSNTLFPQSPSWQITNMPGVCGLNKANLLFIEFTAIILPQLSGAKTNIATLGTLQSPVNYTVNLSGNLGVTKIADKQFVEIGQPFNYVITVTNNGSVPLNTVTVTDSLPACVSINGAVIIKKGATSIAFTGTLPTLIITPSTQLLPGESFVITIPVTKLTGSNCCNIRVTSTASMTYGCTSSNCNLTANFGNTQSPAACVTSVMCCDIEQMTVAFFTVNMNGGIVPVFQINGGPLPIQEVEISLTDYHVTYNNKNCKPSNIGDLFGHITPFVGYSGSTLWDFNSLPALGGGNPPNLTLQTIVTPVNNSLTWGSNTTPIMLNMNFGWSGIIALNFIAPEIVNLTCCSGKVYYCFKVRIKDVNCKVCEKIVCGSFDIPKPSIEINPHEQATSAYKIQSLKDQKYNNVENLLDIFRIPHGKEDDIMISNPINK